MNQIVETIYFGGGTPSLLHPKEIAEILKQIYKNYSISDNVEITIEANPDDIKQEWLEGLNTLNINRWSLGVQSFFNKDLEFMNRSHNTTQVHTSIELLKSFGYNNLSLDLIFAVPGSNLKGLESNLEQLISYEPKHVSVYALTVEENTALHHQIGNGSIKEVVEDIQEEQYFLIHDFLETKGWSHYEISNFAKAGFQSKHNSSYWERNSYLGFGPSAHSFDGRHTRSWNVANNANYIRTIQQGKLPSQKERLETKDTYNEILMTGFRTKKGIDLNKLKILCGEASEQKLRFEAADFKEINIEAGFIKVQPKDWFRSDYLTRKLLWV